MQRSSGVLMHISSLYGDHSIGSFGKSARAFVDFLADSGFSYWQTLPFCMADVCNSPYKSYSAFSLNPYFIDLEILCEKGYLSTREIGEAEQNTPYTCEYARLASERFALLAKASLYAPKDEVKAFIDAHPHIARFCEFMALKEANGFTEWTRWTKKTYDENVLFAWQFMQYEFFVQWMEIKAYANERGIRIIGDMPMFVDYDSSDVYFDKKSFMLDEEGKPKSVAGVPPDYFSEDGQLWGNPHYDWNEMKKDGFSWWKARFEHMLTLFDGVRIDHFRGLSSYYSIPYGAENARKGKWLKAKGKEMLDAVRPITEGKLMIAEDLGDIDAAVEKLVERSGFPGMRVMQFGYSSDEDSIHRTHNYVNGCVAYTGTHDNNTMLGNVWELSEEDRQRLFAYCGYKGDLQGDYMDAIIRTLFASSAGLVILPIQDILGFGADTRMNTPGKPDGNWEFRITKENLDSIDRAKYKALNRLYNRLAPEPEDESEEETEA